MTSRLQEVMKVVIAIATSAVALISAASVARPAGNPWSRGWSVSVSPSAVGTSRFADDLESKMAAGGWGVDVPPFTDPLFGITWPGTTYPIRTRPGGAFGIRVAHAITPVLQVAAGFSNASLGGGSGYDGAKSVEITSSLSSLSALLVVAGGRIQFGGGPTLDWMSVARDQRSEGTTVGVGLTFQAALQLYRQGPFFAGFELGQHFGTSHEIGPYDMGSGSRFPAMKLSPAHTTLGVELGLGPVSE